MKGAIEHVIKLKKIKRRGWVRKGICNAESVADHTFMLTFLAMVFSDILGLDTEKAIRMSLIHDLPESLIGDLTPDEKLKLKKDKIREMENISFAEIFSKLPSKISSKYIKLAEELMNESSPEAKLVKQLDGLEMVIQALEYMNSEGVDLNEFVKSGMGKIKDENIKSLAKELVKK